MGERTRRRVFIDLAPLRQSRDLRWLLGGQLVSLMGNQLTAVAIPYQVYRLTHSSLDVGLVSLAQLIPLLICSLYGGTVIDAVDRRKLLIRVEVVMALCSAGLAINTDLGARLWPLFVLPAIASGLTGFDNPTRNAIVPRMVSAEHISTAAAMVQVLNQVGVIVGPALGGLLLAGAGADFVYWFDAASFLAAITAAYVISPQPAAANATRPGLRAMAEGFRYIRGRPGIQGAYLIDINAMVFGMPRALFPAMAIGVFHGGATTLGFLYAAPGAGALAGALVTGWVTRIRRQGLAVIVAVMVWGAAIVAFGLTSILPLALVFLAIAGWADVISAVLRNTIIQLSVPDRLRGRLAAIQIGVVQGGPRLGDLEAGAVGNAFGNEFSVISGGLACIAGAMALAGVLPGFRKAEVSAATAQAAEKEAAPSP
ncbi:MAG TPA: MFS transporter [Streptosporangiaceae bacterium]|nr:MFS transporter [Streptosporangiaceae bacterium]